MNCRDVREVADSFLSEELLTETNHEILRHLETCPSCRAEVDGRRRLRDALRVAFDRAPDLQPRAGFGDRLRERLREAPARHPRTRRRAFQWLAVAACATLAAGLGAAVFMNRPVKTVDALANDARGDHWNCALKNRVLRHPVPLEEAAQRFDSAYRLLLTAPPDDIETAGGAAHVVDRHSCAYAGRRFGHVILDYRGHVVSLLVTDAGDDAAGVDVHADLAPQLRGRPVNGLSVVSVRGSRHAVLLVSDMDERELTQLSTTVSVPLARQLASALIRPDQGPLAALDWRSSPLDCERGRQPTSALPVIFGCSER